MYVHTGQSGGCSDLFQHDQLADVELDPSQHEAGLSQGLLQPPVIEDTKEESAEPANDGEGQSSFRQEGGWVECRAFVSVFFSVLQLEFWGSLC